MDISRAITFIKTNKAILLLGSAVILIILFISQYGFIEIQTSDTTNDKILYGFFDQQTNKSSTVETSTKTQKKFVKKSSYEVTITQNSKSYFEVVKSKGFFSTSKVTASVKDKNQQTFVGDNPSACIDYINGVLYSYVCGGDFNKTAQHRPATSKTPTYTELALDPNKLDDDVPYIKNQGTITTKEGTLALLIANAENSKHSIYQIDKNFSLRRKSILTALSPAKTYSIAPYREGFVVYDSLFTNFYYYSSSTAQPTSIKIDKPTDKKLKPTGIMANDTLLAVNYSTVDDPSDVEEGTSSDSRIVIYQEGKSRTISWKQKDSGKALLCGNTKLCYVARNRLEVYDITGKQAKPLYFVSNITDAVNIGTNTFVTRKNQVIKLDTDKKAGSVSYDVGKYTVCGTKSTTDGYVLCLLGGDRSKSALFIDTSKPSSDEIAKQIFDLEAMSETKTVSIYKNIIYVVPERGELKYSSKSKRYEYDTEKTKQANAAIDKKIKELGIDTKKYTIINTSK